MHTDVLDLFVFPQELCQETQVQSIKVKRKYKQPEVVKQKLPNPPQNTCYQLRNFALVQLLPNCIWECSM